MHAYRCWEETKIADNFVERILYLLEQQHSQTLSDQVSIYENLRKKIEIDDPSIETEIFDNAVTSIYTAGFRSETAEKYSTKLLERFGLNLQEIVDWGEHRLAKEIGMGRRKNKKVVELCRYIIHIGGVTPFCAWVKSLHSGEDAFSLGPKSDEDFLKCLGYFQHFPVDTLTARFFDRVGLLKYAAKKYDTVINPLGTDRYERLHELMIRVYLEAGDTILRIGGKEYPVKNNLGLIDILVWLHCNENKRYREESICRSKPLCKKCNLTTHCAFYKRHM